MTRPTTAGPVAVAGCRDCGQGRHHCHGTLVRHRAGTWECTGDERCTDGPDSHELVLDCAEIEPACGCTGPGG